MVQVFISSTAELNEYGEALCDWLANDSDLGLFFRAFYYIRHTPQRDEPSVKSEIDRELKASRLFVGLLGGKHGTIRPFTILDRFLRRGREHYTEYEYRVARSLARARRIAIRRFRRGIPSSNGVWEIHFETRDQLISLTRHFLREWMGAQIDAARPSRAGAISIAVLSVVAIIEAAVDIAGVANHRVISAAMILTLMPLPALLVAAYIGRRS